MDAVTLTGIGSIGIGFFLIMGSFLAYYYKKPQALTWGLFGVSLIFLTIIPVSLAIFGATTPPA